MGSSSLSFWKPAIFTRGSRVHATPFPPICHPLTPPCSFSYEFLEQEPSLFPFPSFRRSASPSAFLLQRGHSIRLSPATCSIAYLHFSASPITPPFLRLESPHVRIQNFLQTQKPSSFRPLAVLSFPQRTLIIGPESLLLSPGWQTSPNAPLSYP